MIVLFTDFGLLGPYTGQVKAVLQSAAPSVPVVDLFADAPMRNPRSAAYLLAAYAVWFPAGTVLLSVVDPGVGGDRAPVIVDADGRWYVGPENGLFEIVMRRAEASGTTARSWEIERQPDAPLSASFHGRDLFAPAAARVALGETPSAAGQEPRPSGIGRRPDWPDDLPEIVYVDHYGNAMTGLRAAALPADATFETVAGRCRLTRARTFSDVPPGEAFWYENSNGLAEIAVNNGRADAALGLVIGSPVRIL
jgi:hypothetical protein